MEGSDEGTKVDQTLPAGFRFHPTDEELITCYLINKISDSNFTGRAITDVDLNKCEPWDLPGIQLLLLLLSSFFFFICITRSLLLHLYCTVSFYMEDDVLYTRKRPNAITLTVCGSAGWQ